ncbi:MAG: glycosyltransferase [Patescibacteria group bacterium]|nr:glycosyltransferase [Patescibacteria group bacterium]
MNMKILMISTDKKIFEESSSVCRRMVNYGTIVGELHIIVLNKQSKDIPNKKKIKISEKVIVYPTNSRNKFHYILNAIKIATKLKDVDLVTAQDPYETGFIAWRIVKKLKAKLELQIHTDIFNHYFIRHSFTNRIRSWMSTFLLSKADHIRVVSKRIKSSLSEELQTKVTVLPIFTSPTFIQVFTPSFNLKERYPQFKFIMVMMSRLEKEKNISMAISAMKKVVKIFPKTGLVIVGEGSLRKTLKQQARRAGLEENIIFKKWVGDPITYYKTADLFLSTSDYEGYGLTLSEAVLSHCPILTTKVGIVGEVLSSNNAFLCSVGDKECLVENIIKAQQYPDLLREFEQKAYNDYSRKMSQTEDEVLKILQDAWFRTINNILVPLETL